MDHRLSGPGRRLSSVSKAEKENTDFHIHTLFMAHENKDTGGVTSAGLLAFAVECNLLEKRLTKNDVGLIFDSVKLGKKTSLSFDRFKEAVRKMAVKKEVTYQELAKEAMGKDIDAVFGEDYTKEDGEALSEKNFEMLQVLGTGSWGKVRLVRKLGDDVNEYYAMKSIEKRELWRLKHSQSQINAMTLRHPFLVNMEFCFQTHKKFHMVTEFMDGGEMFLWLRKSDPDFFTLARATLYCAEVLLALEFLHSHGMVYGHLKPENVMIDAQGHACLSDAGLWRGHRRLIGLSEDGMADGGATLVDCTETVEYQPPEVISGATIAPGSEKAMDFWQLGILLYEMMVGEPPFKDYGDDKEGLANEILTRPVFGEQGASKRHQRGSIAVRASTVVDSAKYVHAKDFITKVTVKDPLQRLGSEGGVQQLKEHTLFSTIDWTAVANLECPPEAKPPTRKLSQRVSMAPGMDKTLNLAELALDPRDSFAPMPNGFDGFEFEEA
jgi:serine/threonine protein kinase